MQWNWRIKVQLTVLLGLTLTLCGWLVFNRIPRHDPLGPFVLANVTSAGAAIVLLAAAVCVCAIFGQAWLGRALPHVGWLRGD